MRALHKQAMMKQQIYESIISRRSGIYYSQGIRFQTRLVNVDESKALTKENLQGKRIRIKEDGADVAPSKTYKLPQMIYLWGFLIKRPKLGLGNGAIYGQDKEVSRRCSSRGRHKLIWDG